MAAAGNAIRDVRSADDFWVVQMFGVYEAEEKNSYDPDGADAVLGASVGDDGPCAIYLETIRDRAAVIARAPAPGDPGVPRRLAEQPEKELTIYHESLHRFGLAHDVPPGDAGPLRPEAGIYQWNAVASEWEYDPASDNMTAEQIDIVRRQTHPNTTALLPRFQLRNGGRRHGGQGLTSKPAL